MTLLDVLSWERRVAKLLFRDGRSDKGNCTAGQRESHGYQGLPKGSVRTGYQGNQRDSKAEGVTDNSPGRKSSVSEAKRDRVPSGTTEVLITTNYDLDSNHPDV
jgi:hypothetical protein